ncbi:MAG: hypothetical protein H6708_24505 [Kofleriaceae bacterium]|nr:hypothetical protein [Kofleriaceae bacterium]
MTRSKLHAVVRNGALLGVPPLVLSLSLWGLLPVAYSPAVFWDGVPSWLGLCENVARIVVFALPIVLCFGASTPAHRAGWVVYGAGVVAYAASYLLLVAWPSSAWATSLVGFTAPGWSTAIWFAGIAMVCRDSWLVARWRWWFYLVPVAGFLGFHLAHAALIWSRLPAS